MHLNRRLVLGAGVAAIAANGAAEAATRSSGGGRAHRTALSALSRYAEQHVRDWGLPGGEGSRSKCSERLSRIVL